MDILEFSFNAVAPLFIVIFLGWFIARRGLLQEKEITFLNALCFRYLLPIYIFSSVMTVDYSREFNFRMFAVFFSGVSLIALASLCVASLVIRDPARRCIFIVNSYRSNNLIYALPLAANLFGDAGLKPAAMLVPFTIIIFNVYSVLIMVLYKNKINSADNHKKLSRELSGTLFEVIKNPLIIGSAAGILIALTGLDIPFFLRKGINSIGAAASPLSLLLLGSQIDFSKLRQDIGAAAVSCIIRLVLCPLITTPALILLGFRGPELSTLAIAFAAPCAIATFIMSRNYQIAARFAAQTVYLSTVLSIFTIFCLISILRALKYF
ncbi:MAG: AEC family transporter [Spirochaetaceae bacterium]|jgi:predicted permease|nr:AEC family transporter [Spirochaetaceae bacterium]